MTVWNSLRSTFLSALHHPRLWLLQFFGMAAILLIAGSWLHIPDSYWWQLAFQFVIALVVILAFLALQGGTLNFYLDTGEEQKATLASAFKTAVRPTHLLAFAIWVAFILIVLHFVDKLYDYQYELPGYLRSGFPAGLRSHITEDAMDSFYMFFLAFLRWVLVPGLLLPLGLLCANTGLKGFVKFRSWLHSLRSLPYWIVLILAALIGPYCFGKLMGWKLHPVGPAVTKEGIWFAFRLLIASLLALFSWFWVCAMLGRAYFRPGPPAASQKVAA